MNGFYNVILNIDVSQKSFELERLADADLSQTLGGKGLATRLLLEKNPTGVDPLSPDNHLIFAAGPITKTAVWGSCRHGVFTKSPQTGLYSESYSGGKAAESMSACGFDAILLHGAADDPVWLEVCDDTVYFHPADALWGLDSFETEDRVKDWIKSNRTDAKRPGVVTIGPAGENQVVFAVIENDYWRSAGRTGVGAVMGSKRVKAIAFRGERQRRLADVDLIKSFSREMAKSSKDNPGVFAYKSMGTPMLVDIMNSVGGFPTEYWRKGRADHADKINATALHDRCDVKPHSCLKCFMACGRLSTVKSGRHKGLTVEGPEYETIYAFGGLCKIDSIEEIAHLNDRCDRLGLDTITAGNLAALTIEASRQGRIDLSIDYNEVDKIGELLEQIATRQGIGDILARGIRFAAAQWDMADQAIHVKGMEPAGYDPRVLKGMGLAYGSSARGACHLRATFYKPELTKMIDPDQIQGKAEMFVEWEDRLTIFDTLILCRFYRDLYQWDQLRTIIKGATGLDLDQAAMQRIAARVTNDTRRFNIREGLTPSDDLLPCRFHEEPLPESNNVITAEQMQQLLKDYYAARGWNKDGHPLA